VLNGADPALARLPRSPDNPYGNGRTGHALATLPADSSPSNASAIGFVREVLDELRSLAPGLTVNVLGSDGEEGSGLRYLGFQPEIRPWLDHADACLMPYPQEAALFGGPRNKLIEYLVRGRTVVTTPEGLRGLGQAADWDGVYVAAPDPAEFARAVATAVRSDAETLDRSREAARRLTWDRLAGEVVAILRSVVAREA
jgi:glycosyltransferase involved in cell wall biosynthesis